MYLSPVLIFLLPWLIGSISTYYFSDYSVIFSSLSGTGTWYLSLILIFLIYNLIIFNIQRKSSVDLEVNIKNNLNFNSFSSLVKLFCFAHISIFICLHLFLGFRFIGC